MSHIKGMDVMKDTVQPGSVGNYSSTEETNMYKLTRGQPSGREGNTSTAEQRKEWAAGLPSRKNGHREKGKSGRESPGIR